MKSYIKAFCFSLVLVWVIPSFVLSFYTYDDVLQIEQTEPFQETEAKNVEVGYVRFYSDDGVQILSWENYLTGVLLSEIPGFFHAEAKKAQAVVARTYATKIMDLGYKHPEGSVCGDPNCCQGYLSVARYMDLFSDISVVNDARDAVKATAGEVVTYNGNLIDATYFSCSGGRTEDAVAVWGTDIPYLQTVESPGEEEAAVYTDLVEFTPEEFMARLGVSLPGAPSGWFGSVQYTQGGGVKTILICGQEYEGTDLRMQLGLRSTAFTIEVRDSRIYISTRGFGHRVGMSQYGADAMGRAGADYQEIIAYYYQGVHVERVDSFWDD